MSAPALEPSDVARFTRGVALPEMYLLRQRFDALPPVDAEEAAHAAVAGIRGLDDLKGKRVGIAAGSRGVSELATVVRTVVRWVKERGGHPVVLPAMGSHGGATPAGQERVLAELGVTLHGVEAPVRSSLDVQEVGEAMGRSVLWSTDALHVDTIVVVNRVKPHTCFRGRVESGLTKMLVIGLGKQRGAAQVHGFGDDRLGAAIPAFAEVILRAAPPTFGVAVVENSYHQICHVEAMPAARFARREPELLAMAGDQLPRIRLDHADVLVVDRMGKDVSGDGMDPNVTGRFANPSLTPDGFAATRIVVLGLTPHTQGNAHGIGLADVTTRAVLAGVGSTAVSAALLDDVADDRVTIVDGPRRFFAAMPR